MTGVHRIMCIAKRWIAKQLTVAHCLVVDYFYYMIAMEDVGGSRQKNEREDFDICLFHSSLFDDWST